jgi:hypothetical protein
MRKRLMTLTMGLLLGLSILAPRPAAALSCVHPRDQLPTLPLIVQGKVERVAPHFRLPGTNERPESITLAVSRYFKGEGPEKLEAVFDGMGWETMNPVGSEVIMGFWIDEQGEYKSGACTLRISAQPTNAFESEMVDLIHARYGEGRAPIPGNDHEQVVSAPRGEWVLWVTLGGFTALILYLRLRRKGRR